MKISVTQTTKQLKSGEYLIAVRVFDGGKYKHYSTSVSCTKANWNVKTSTVSSKDRNYQEKNKVIQDKLNEIQKSYGNDIAEEEPNKIETFFDVINKKIEECESYSYKKNFLQLNNYLKVHYSILTISMINKVWFDGFVENLQKNKSIQQANKLVKHFKIIYQYGLDCGYITKYYNFKYKKEHSIQTEKYLTTTEFSAMLALYHQALQTFHLIGKDKDVTLKNEESVMLFMLHIAFQGIAPIDMANLKVKDIKYETIEKNGRNILKELNSYSQENISDKVEIINIQLHRQKTGEYVNIITYKRYIEDAIRFFSYGKSEDDFFIDCLDKNKTYTDKQIDSRVSNYYNKLCKKLNECYESFCNRNKLQEKHITYYMARHTFINKLYSLGISENEIKRLVGHKDSTLQRYYVADVEKIKQAEIVAKVFEEMDVDNWNKEYH